MVERIKQLMAAKNLTLSSFATETNINPATINHIINGREVDGKGKVHQTPSTDVITKILSTFPDINAEWLLMGSGPMMKGRHTVIQPELFSDIAIKPPTSPASPVYRQEKEDKIEETAIKIPTKQPVMPELSLSENIDKIVIFFKNKTYVTLKPEEE
jgi:transcriptional regulator with XRE-family HTH domain